MSELAEDLEQLDLFEARRPSNGAPAQVVATRGPGRPVGARNKRTDEAARFYKARFGDPLARGIEISALPILANGVLVELEPNALYGALLSLRDGAQQKDQVGQWAALGGRAFAREARLQDEGKEAIVLTFPAAIARDATMLLRAAGFRFNKVLQHWEGLAHYDEAQKLATAHGGALRRVATSQPYPAPVPDRAAE